MKKEPKTVLHKKYKYPYEAGCDEAGRGCLAGPVVAAAVMINNRKKVHSGIRDSKKLSTWQRAELSLWIRTHALDYGIGIVGPEEIDEINILRASMLAMHRALDQFDQRPRHILVDGNRFEPYHDISHTCFIGGDDAYYSIAAASILAKYHRDEIMKNLHSEYPQYGWKSNKGYPTAAHRTTVLDLGPSPHHRKSFRVTRPVEQYELKFNSSYSV